MIDIMESFVANNRRGSREWWKWLGWARELRLVTRAAQRMRVELSMKTDERAYMVSTLPREILLAFSIPYSLLLVSLSAEPDCIA